MAGRVAVIRDGVSERVTESGIVIPEIAQEKPQLATVAAFAEVGRDEQETEMLAKLFIGARVLLGKYSGSEVEINGKHVTLLQVGDIMGVFE